MMSAADLGEEVRSPLAISIGVFTFRQRRTMSSAS